MSKDNPKNTEILHIYIEGANPSGRDIHNFCTMIESSIVISVLEYQRKSDKDFKFYNLNNEYEEFLKKKYVQHDYGLDETIERLTNLVIASVFREPYYTFDPKREMEFQRSRNNYREFREELNYLRHEIHRSSRRFRDRENILEKHNLKNSPRILDFDEWVSQKYGNNILNTERVETTNSIELFFNLMSVGAILGFQNIPEIKDMALYMEVMFNNWIGKIKSNNNSEIKIPSLPISMERTISKFDEVELTQNADGWTIRLKKNS